MRDLFLAFFWLAAIPITLIEPAAGIAFWIWDALLSPTELAYSFMSGVSTNKLIAIVTLCSLAFNFKKRQIYFDRTHGILLAIVFVATMSNITALVPGGTTDSLYDKLLKEVVLSFAITFLVVRREWLYVTIMSVCLALGFFGVKEGLIALLTVGGHHITGARATGDNNQFAAALLATVPLMAAMWKCTPSKPVRTGFLVSIFLTVVTVIMSYSRGAAVGLLVMALLFIGRSRRPILMLCFLGMAVVAVFAFAPKGWSERVDTIQTASDDNSFMGRVIAWKISTLIALSNPVFGGGQWAVQQGPVWFKYAEQFDRLDFIPTPPLLDQTPHAAHSMYFEILGDLGFSGLFVYGLLLYTVFSNLRQARRAARASGDMAWMIDICDGLWRSMISYMVTGALLSVTYYELLYILVALSVCCRRLARQHLAKPVPEQAPMLTLREALLPTGRVRQPAVPARAALTMKARNIRA